MQMKLNLRAAKNVKEVPSAQTLLSLQWNVLLVILVQLKVKQSVLSVHQDTILKQQGSHPVKCVLREAAVL